MRTVSITCLFAGGTPPPLSPPPPTQQEIGLFKRWDQNVKRLMLVLAGPRHKGTLSKKFLGLHGLL